MLLTAAWGDAGEAGVDDLGEFVGLVVAVGLETSV